MYFNSLLSIQILWKRLSYFKEITADLSSFNDFFFSGLFFLIDDDDDDVWLTRIKMGEKDSIYDFHTSGENFHRHVSKIHFLVKQFS